jgi:hypothetical protein
MSNGHSVRRTTSFSERSLLPHTLVLLTMGLLLSALPALAKAPQQVTLKHQADIRTAGIENTGSTNTMGYAIAISSNYSARTNGHPVMSRMPHGIVDKFFTDLTAAMPLTSLPVRHGMRSASFGTQTYITYKGQKSPDLTFASDPRTVALKADIDNITKALHVGNAPRRLIVIHADR